MSRQYANQSNESDEENEQEPYELVYAGEEHKRSYVSKDGHARAVFPNGDIYEGAYVNQSRDGVGEYIFSYPPKEKNDHSNEEYYAKYTGEYKQGKKNGTGIFHYPDKSIYNGEYKDDKKDGHGVYTYINGDKYVGQWQSDERNGDGVYLYAHNGTELSGKWKNGKLFNGEWRFYEGGKEFVAIIKNGKVLKYTQP